MYISGERITEINSVVPITEVIIARSNNSYYYICMDIFGNKLITY